MRVATLALASLSCSYAKDIVLATFDGAEGTTHKWAENNDPVMGGKSTGTTTVQDGKLVFDGTVAIVPSLQAPGFITSVSTDSTPWPDITGCEAIKVNLMSTVEYTGYRLNFGRGHPIWGKFFAYGYKAHFTPPVGKFGDVVIPIKNFTDYWDDATGKPIKTCQDNSYYCPNEETLKDLKTMGFWGEGVEGKVHLEVKSVSATGCKDNVDATPKADYVDLMGDKKFSAECDPVMGGQSVAKWDQASHTFSGEVKIVPSLKAPGFCITLTESPLLASFPDASGYDGLALGLNNHGPVTSFKAAFCTSRINFECQFKSFKADFNATVGEGEAFIPWNSFSDKWSSATGEPTSHNPPTAQSLKDITQLQLWVEGLAGKFDVEINYVRARKTPAPTGAVCKTDEYCCPDAKHCLKPTFKSCANDESVCAADQTCCPVTKECVVVGAACKSPCASSAAFCCPDAKHCLTPVKPGAICDPSNKTACAKDQVCCPVAHECVTVGEPCTPP